MQVNPLKPPRSQLWKLDIHAETFLEMALIFPCMEDGAAARHFQETTDSAARLAMMMHPMLWDSPFFWGALQEPNLPEPIVQRLVLALIVCYLLDPQFEQSAQTQAMAFKVFEKSLLPPSDSLRTFLRLDIEFRTVLFCSRADTDAVNNLESEFKSPLPARLAAMLTRQQTLLYGKHLDDRWHRLLDLKSDDANLNQEYPVQSFMQDLKLWMASVSVRLNDAYPPAQVREMIARHGDAYRFNLYASTEGSGKNSQSTPNSQSSHTGQPNQPSRNNRSRNPTSESQANIEWDTNLIPAALLQQNAVDELDVQDTVFLLESELAQLEERKAEIIESIAKLREHQANQGAPDQQAGNTGQASTPIHNPLHNLPNYTSPFEGVEALYARLDSNLDASELLEPEPLNDAIMSQQLGDYPLASASEPKGDAPRTPMKKQGALVDYPASEISRNTENVDPQTRSVSNTPGKLSTPKKRPAPASDDESDSIVDGDESSQEEEDDYQEDVVDELGEGSRSLSQTSRSSRRSTTSRKVRESKRQKWDPKTLRLLNKALTEYDGDIKKVYAKYGPDGKNILGQWSLQELEAKIRAASLGPKTA